MCLGSSQKAAVTVKSQRDFIAQQTEGASGADLNFASELPKLIFPDALAAEELKACVDDVDGEAASETLRGHTRPCNRFNLTHMNQSSGDGGYAFVHDLGRTAIVMFVFSYRRTK